MLTYFSFKLPALDFADGILAVNDFFVNACGQSALGTVAVSDLLVYPEGHKSNRKIRQRGKYKVAKNSENASFCY